MNIAVFGWYHHQNAGDDRMQQCITRWLDGHCLAFLPAGRLPPVAMLRTYDAAIIGGGSLISAGGGMFRHMSRWVRNTGIPVAMLGVTVDSVTPELRQELREFLDVCCFTWFRDQESLDLVGAHPKAFAAPDLTWLYPQPVLPTPAANSAAIAVCLRRQRDLPVNAWREALSRLNASCVPWPLYFENGGDCAVLREVLPAAPASEFPEEFSMEPLRQTRAAIAGRFHGVLFALQSGLPVLAVSSLPKTVRFMAQNGLAEWVVPENAPERLADLWPRFTSQLSGLHVGALTIREQLQNQARAVGVKAREQLLAAAGSLPPPGRRLGNQLRKILSPGDWV